MKSSSTRRRAALESHALRTCTRKLKLLAALAVLVIAAVYGQPGNAALDPSVPSNINSDAWNAAASPNTASTQRTFVGTP